VLILGPGDELEAVAYVRGLVQGRELPPQGLGTVDTQLPQWSYLAQRLMMARYAAIFYEPTSSAASASDLVGQAIANLVRDLHRHTRAVALRLGAAWNAVGAAHVLTWQSGFPAAVSFAAGFPEYLPGEASARVLLERREVDAVLVLGADPLSHLSEAAREHLQSIPTVVIDDALKEIGKRASVTMLTARFGMETAGNVFRSDGVCLPLRPAMPPQLPTAEHVLSQLADRLTASTLPPAPRRTPPPAAVPVRTR
jgi:formylmethanofuran dehydrogenase subunit B